MAIGRGARKSPLKSDLVAHAAAIDDGTNAQLPSRIYKLPLVRGSRGTATQWRPLFATTLP